MVLWDRCQPPGPRQWVLPAGSALEEPSPTWSFVKPGWPLSLFSFSRNDIVVSSLFMQLLGSFSNGPVGRENPHPPFFPQRERHWVSEDGGGSREQTAAPFLGETETLLQRPVYLLNAQSPHPGMLTPLSNFGSLVINLCNPVFGETCFSKRACSGEPKDQLSLHLALRDPTCAHTAWLWTFQCGITERVWVRKRQPWKQAQPHKLGDLGSVSFSEACLQSGERKPCVGGLQ